MNETLHSISHQTITLPNFNKRYYFFLNTKKTQYDILKYTREAHKVYSLHYPLVFVGKYRQHMFVEDHELITSSKTTFEDISEKYGLKIKEMECGMDHIHSLVSKKTALNIPSYINALKGLSLRSVRKIFHNFLKYTFWIAYFWAPSYFIDTTCNVSIYVLKHYIKSQNRRYN